MLLFIHLILFCTIVSAPEPSAYVSKLRSGLKKESAATDTTTKSEEENVEEKIEEESSDTDSESSNEPESQVAPAMTEPLKYPDVFIIGAQRCGTTAMNNVLFTHPNICGKGTKEKHFFSNKDYEKHFVGYKQEFEGCKKDQLTVDVTPKYIFGDEIPERINKTYGAEQLSQKKFIAILREPIARQYSEYQRLLRLCFRVIDENDKEANAIKAKPSSSGTATKRPPAKKGKLEPSCTHVLKFAPTKHPTKYPELAQKDNAMLFFEWTGTEHGEHERGRGNYVGQLKRWLSVIKRSQIFIINFQTLISNASDTFFRMSAFLGLNADLMINDKKNQLVLLPPPPAANAHVDWSPGVLDCRTYGQLQSYYNSQNDGLSRLINDAKDRPKEEPQFPPFVQSRSDCKDV